MQAVEPTHESVSWVLMIPCALSSMLGIGVLVVPGDMERLGWIPGFLSITFFALSSAYAGVLLARLFAQRPWCSTLADLVAVPAFRRFCFGKIMIALTYSSAFAAPALFHFVLQDSLSGVFGPPTDPLMSPTLTSLLVALLLLPTCFIEKLEEIGWLSVLGNVSLSSALCVLGIKLLLIEPLPAQGPETDFVAPTSLATKLIGLLDILFVFSGQSNWGRLIEGMNQRSHFAWSASIACALLFVIVMFVASVGYATHGGHLNMDDPITAGLHFDAWTRAINAGLFVGIYAVDALQINVCCQLFLETVLPKLFKPEVHGHTLGSVSEIETPYLTRSVAASLKEAEADEAGSAYKRSGLSEPLLRHPKSFSHDQPLRLNSLVMPGTGSLEEHEEWHRMGAGERESLLLYSEDEHGFGSSPDLTAPRVPSRASVMDPSLAAKRRVAKKMIWATTALFFIGSAWTLSAACPFLPEVMAFVSALGSVTAMFLLPCSLALKFLHDLSGVERVLCWVGCVLSVVLSVLGCVASVVMME